jgi:hypothetical protein
MTRYFLAPRSGETSHQNYLSTLEHGVPYSRIEPYLNPEGKELLSKQETIYAWANREGRRAAWERMEIGDIVIFYAKGNFVMAGEVMYKQASRELALAMWPADEHGNPWEYTYYLKNPKYFNFPLKVFNIVSGYKLTAVMGFMEIEKSHVEQILTKYSSVEDFFYSFGEKMIVEEPKTELKVHVNIPTQVVVTYDLRDLVPYESNTQKITRQRRTGFVDFEEIHKRNSTNGSKGEELVLKEERAHLDSIGRSDLAQKVKRISIDDTYAGYDILSFDDKGNEKFIEVKSSITPRSKEFSFHLSANEKRIAETTENYYIYLVFDVNGNYPTVTPIGNPLKSNFLKLEPTNFRVRGMFEKD